jgi:hypothetical protein
MDPGGKQLNDSSRRLIGSHGERSGLRQGINDLRWRIMLDHNLVELLD